MTRPQRYLFRMVLFLIAVGAAAFLLLGQLQEAFFANPALNGLILGVLLIGIMNSFRQVFMLNPEVRWLEEFKSDRPTTSSGTQPHLLAPMATMLREREGGEFTLSALSTRSLLDGIATRLEEQRDLSRYNIGLLIFLGLLGTFWGLLGTVSSVGDVISNLTIGSGGDLGVVFNELKRGLEAPIEGMGTAFSSSLFGLAGSLVLGFLDLQMGQSQNRFYTDLEDWLASQTRLSSGALSDAGGDQSVPAYVQALLEQTADSLDKLQRTMTKSEESKSAANSQFMELTSKLGTLSDTMRTEQALMQKLAEGQLAQKALLDKIAHGAGGGGAGLDDTSKGHLRNIDIYTQRLVEDMQGGREETVSQIRQEIRLLARTIAAKDA
ncbi:MotA/TolQ/ExbB proton channel family protein [Candidatus Terasakiella magnetica]|uniref:MotA/TolQ/ExbB proton channel family protein n=1 Tax=Candidatus Terasakiella magnetica TaxID=1867952 RepID=A0A1C3RHL9_9PROT|nr:flagellar motor protein MotA [Candidatus Terasakiella magnetica]SCA56770.1 MotA/TolQ/ExbB proton channel family protein [Candidatus Terasakiella magnetica]